MLEEFEVQQTEEVKMTGFDMLQIKVDREHMKNGKVKKGVKAWESVSDDTTRVGIVSGVREEEEILIPQEEKSPFDGDEF